MSNAGHRHTAEAKARISEAMKRIRATESAEQRLRRVPFGRVLSQATRSKISRAHLGMKHTPETRAKISRAKTGLRPNLSPEQRAAKSARFKGRPSPYPNRRFYYKGVPFRSSWEVRAAKALDALDIRWEYESRRIDLGTQTWAPDFYLPDMNAFWEVKGYFGPKSRRTVDLFRSLRDEPLVVVSEKVLKILEQSAARVAA
jgi:hypothetical protein